MRTRAPHIGLLLLLTSCAGGKGRAVPEATLNFPTVLATARQSCGGKPCYLVVANANFDLRYANGTLMSFDLERVHAQLSACTTRPCELPTPKDYLAPDGEVLVDSYVYGLATAPQDDRLYVSARSDATLSRVGITPEGGLRCGSGGSYQRDCASAFDEVSRSAADAAEVGVPTDALQLHTGPAGTGSYVVMGHRGGLVSLFFDTGPVTDKPLFASVASTRLPSLAGLGIDSQKNYLYGTSAGSPFISRLGFVPDPQVADFSSPRLYSRDPFRIVGVRDGTDVRDAVTDPLTGDLFLLSRKPEAVFSFAADAARSEAGNLTPNAVIGVGAGPSRVAFARLGASQKRWLFVSCFNSRDLYTIDVELGRVVGVLRGLSGPFGMAIDAARSYLYIADFQTSVIRFVDLSPLASGGTPELAGSLGTLRPVKALR